MTFLLDHDVPENLTYSLRELGHQVLHLRNVLPLETDDRDVLAYAHKQGWVLITCNRDDYLALARTQPHCGLIILIRRRTRVAERTALVRLLDKAGDPGITNNINFA
jgi:predicted nuclease of predicted toxin-antitoxin system